MKVYIATSLGHAESAQIANLRSVLAEAGHTITFDWHAAGPVSHDDPVAMGIRAIQDAKGVTTADAVIAVMPGGRGTHFEMGLAVGAGVPCILWMEEETGSYPCVFHLHPAVWRADRLEDVMAHLRGLAKEAPDA